MCSATEEKIATAITHFGAGAGARSEPGGGSQHLGNALEHQGAAGRGNGLLRARTALKPDYPGGGAHYNRSLLLLLLGDFARGWAEYELRWRCKVNRNAAIRRGRNGRANRLVAETRLKVGLVWSGNPANRMDPCRSIPLAALENSVAHSGHRLAKPPGWVSGRGDQPRPAPADRGSLTAPERFRRERGGNPSPGPGHIGRDGGSAPARTARPKVWVPLTTVPACDGCSDEMTVPGIRRCVCTAK